MKTERFVRFNKHVQEITFTHFISNDARLYKKNKNIKYNMFICNIYISMNEKGKTIRLYCKV